MTIEEKGNIENSNGSLRIANDVVATIAGWPQAMSMG
jgi:hypothetical protein